MNTTQLDSILSALHSHFSPVLLKSNSSLKARRCTSSPTNSLYLGVFSADNIPLEHLCNQTKTVYFVLNSDPSSSPGTHWLACVKPPGSILEFFDSYGNSPNFYHFSFPSTLSILHNHDPFQSVYSSVCGQYCIYFLYFRIFRKVSLQKISTHLRTSFKTRKLRDHYISNYVNILSRKFTNGKVSLLKKLITANHSSEVSQNSSTHVLQSSQALHTLPHNFLDFSNAQTE